MSGAPRHYRLDGIYRQRQEGFFMQRIKLAGGMISSAQAAVVAALSERYARGTVHLTTRGSMELHWLTEAELAPVARTLASVGLVSRGACGGAVRGVVCGGFGASCAPILESLVRRLHRHFTGNPRFESLPKKFKIGVEADTASGRHLIQDIGLIPVHSDDAQRRYDVWAAGGLGREPSPGFLLAEAVAEPRLFPLIEAVLRIYEAHTPAGKRLKHLVRETGREVFRQMVFADPGASEELAVEPSLADSLLDLPAAPGHRLEIPVFAGELPASRLKEAAAVAERLGGGMLVVNGEQNLVLHLEGEKGRAEAEATLGGGGTDPRDQVRFRICPGNHECIMGLAPTRDIAEAMIGAMGSEGRRRSWAISGCPNCCAQPQLCDCGVVVSRLTGKDAERSPRFDLYRRHDDSFAAVEKQGLTLDELLGAVR